ncbi:MAG: phosphoribosylformylglycinamidine synthase subunit PurL [Aestuariivita sp.]|nr:phosphoribosylformylglycinamidine synthase subunit PurL [Aestuariivita sp.]MCY4202089.1 phosphoribosylformylglycinamidine synthase subunit PurL [Aestuariivita sp.]
MQDTIIAADIIKNHGLTKSEYKDILAILGREPSITELGIFSAMWNEHCSYKSSKKWLKTLPTTGPHVVCGPGENAGVIDIGDGDVLAFKMESHNHPSFIEPYQGAATGMGGILRDIFTMGARPIAAMNCLSFGEISNEKTRHLVHGVVAGIGGYGNSFGVPCVGGEIRFHPSYNKNCLVNAFAAGITKRDKLFFSAAVGVGMPVVYLGAKTGRDGVGGATMASNEFGDDYDDNRPAVQIGDPFTEKRLMEACLEIMASGAVVAIQDMGAAGLTCSAVEMGSKGELGIRLTLDDVPQRESEMTAYEMMLSESQERMLMILNPKKEKAAREIFNKWDLDFAIIGETLARDRFEVWHLGEMKADLPLSPLSQQAPEYDRPWEPTPKAHPVEAVPRIDPIDALRELICSPNYAAKNWIFEQYDTMVLAETVRPPGLGAGLIRVHNSEKILAFTADVTPRYVKANPKEGGKQAVAEAYRNLSSVGAKPLAITDNLNFGNPEKPEIMGQLVEAIQGIAEASRVLAMPVVSGNVSLYNETEGEAILPTPTIGAVGITDSADKIIGNSIPEGSITLLIGQSTGHLGQSALLAEVFNREDGDAPPVDLREEKQNGQFVRDNRSLIHACTDLADGGLALAAFKMAEAAKIGVYIANDDTDFLFGEDQARYLLASSFDQAEELMVAAAQSDVTIQTIGSFTGTDVVFGTTSTPLDELSELYQSTLERAMS